MQNFESVLAARIEQNAPFTENDRKLTDQLLQSELKRIDADYQSAIDAIWGKVWGTAEYEFAENEAEISWEQSRQALYERVYKFDQQVLNFEGLDKAVTGGKPIDCISKDSYEWLGVGYVAYKQQIEEPLSEDDLKRNLVKFLVNEEFAEIEDYPDWVQSYGREELQADFRYFDIMKYFDRFSLEQRKEIRDGASYIASELHNGLFSNSIEEINRILVEGGPYPVDIAKYTDPSLSADEMKHMREAMCRDYELGTYGFVNPEGKLTTYQMANKHLETQSGKSSEERSLDDVIQSCEKMNKSDSVKGNTLEFQERE